MTFIQIKKQLLFSLILCISVLFISCKGAHELVVLHSGNEHAFLTPSKEIRIIKIFDLPISL